MNQQYDTLFIGASFFGYAREIVSQLDSRGHRTIWFEDRPGTDTLTKALVRLSSALIAGKIEAYFNGIIEQLRGQPIRDVFVIKGEAVTVSVVRRLRAAFPKARFTLYFWDSYRNMPKGTEAKVDLFDRAFTFDPVDAEADHRLTYRPLFHLKEFTALAERVRDIDILFIGTAHSDRYDVLKRIETAIPTGYGFTKLLYYPSRSLYQIKRVLRPSQWRSTPPDVIFKPLQKPAVLALIARAKVIVDVERPVQTGYTIRTIEAVAAGRKLITTNPRIRDADFYRSANHLYIDRHNPRIDADFLDGPVEVIPHHIIRRYDVDGWLNDIFGCETPRPPTPATKPERVMQEVL